MIMRDVNDKDDVDVDAVVMVGGRFGDYAIAFNREGLKYLDNRYRDIPVFTTGELKKIGGNEEELRCVMEVKKQFLPGRSWVVDGAAEKEKKRRPSAARN